jgi:hypothetical protein
MDFERHIDDVARALTLTPRHAALREAVIRRLDARKASGPTALPWVSLVTTAAALVLIATWIARPAEVVPNLRALLVRTAGALLPLPGATRLPAPPHLGRRSIAPAIEVEETFVTTRSLPSLETPARLAISSIQPQRVTVPLLHMAPVVAEPISVAPVPAIAPLDTRPNSRS